MRVEYAADPHQPVLVGIGTCLQREDDFALASEPMDLMLEAVRSAGQDAGSARLLAGVQRIAVPKGRWRYQNPGGEIARTIGANEAVSVLANVGVLQQSLIGDACSRIASGEIHSALVAGADTGYRIAGARKAGAHATERQQGDRPDIHLEAAEELLHPAELAAGIRMPVALYAMLASAWRARHGLGVDEHRRRMGDMLHRFSEIAAANPHSWRRSTLEADAIVQPSERNPMLAFPYTRLHCASWNVDQAGALLLCSAERAAQLGIAREKWIYAISSTESNHMLPVSVRADLAACPGARLAGKAALEAGGLVATPPDLVELYSCFPIAVEVYATELGLSLQRDLTVTGGMSFAGGPFNNYVLQATCRSVELLRGGHGRTALVSSVSGILTKQGFGLWSVDPGVQAFRWQDLSPETASASPRREVVYQHSGPATIAAYTVVHDPMRAPRMLALADTAGGHRVLAWSEHPAWLAKAQASELCGATISVDGTAIRPA